MANDEQVKSRAAARSAPRSASQVRSAGHAASGGHAKTLNTLNSRWVHEPGDVQRHHHGSHMADWQEYPKHVYPDSPDGSYQPGLKSVIVNSEEEEEAVFAGRAVVREADEKKRLIALAEVKGVQIDKRWSLDRIRSAVESAADEQGFDPTLDPAV